MNAEINNLRLPLSTIVQIMHAKLAKSIFSGLLDLL